MSRAKQIWLAVAICGVFLVGALVFTFAYTAVTIASDEGIPVMLPPKQEIPQQIEVEERNIYNISINSSDMLLVEENPMALSQLKKEVKKFITNNGKDPNSSESPQKAVISLKTGRGTSYEMYIKVRDELQTAYNELRAESLNLSLEDYLELAKERDEAENKERYDMARAAFPVMISDAEPTD